MTLTTNYGTTAKEAALIREIVQHDTYGERGNIDNGPWSWAICDGSKSKAAVLGSLVTKGLAWQQGEGRDASCGLTDAGKIGYIVLNRNDAFWSGDEAKLADLVAKADRILATLAGTPKTTEASKNDRPAVKADPMFDLRIPAMTETPKTKEPTVPTIATPKTPKVKTPKATKPAAAPKTPKAKPAAKPAPAKKDDAAKARRTVDTSRPLAERKWAAIVALRKLKATGATAAASTEAIVAEAGVTKFDVYAMFYHKNELAVGGFVRQVKVEGVRGLCYYLTAKGLKATKEQIAD